jgi:hypothetical protein
MCVARAPSRARAAASFAIAMAAPIAGVVAWFAMRGALGPMFDVLVAGNEAYLRKARTVRGFDDFIRCSFELFGWFHPVSTLLLIATTARVVVSRVRRDPDALRPWALGVALVGAGYLSVIAQLRFHIYHYVTIVPGIALLLLRAIEDVSRVASRPFVRTAAIAGAAVIVVALYPLSGRRAKTWWAATSAEARFRLGRAQRADVDSVFATAGGRAYVYTESVAVGTWLAEHSSTSDLIAVRGCHPEIYTLAERTPASRFFWTTAYTHAMWSHRGAEWAEEDRSTLDRVKPRFVVTDANAQRPESPSYFLSRGYRKAATLGRYIVLERQ